MEFILFLLFISLGKINSFQFKTKKNEREYCFYKNVLSDNQTISFNFACTGDGKEYIDVTLSQISPVKKDIHSFSKSEYGNFKTNLLNEGKYKLCFYPYSTNSYYVWFTYQTSEEDGDIKDIATDSELKEIREKVKDISEGLKNIRHTSNNLISKKFTHFLYLCDYVWQIKLLTFAKILIVGLMSLFQIYVIQKMFGEDKRMSQIKTSSNKNNKIEFL